jgi:hypothetical protein
MRSVTESEQGAGIGPIATILFSRDRFKLTLQLRRTLANSMKELFPNNVEIRTLPGRTRPVLRVDGHIIVSLLLKGDKRIQRSKLRWVIEPVPEERSYITLLCKLSSCRDFISNY